MKCTRYYSENRESMVCVCEDVDADQGEIVSDIVSVLIKERGFGNTLNS